MGAIREIIYLIRVFFINLLMDRMFASASDFVVVVIVVFVVSSVTDTFVVAGITFALICNCVNENIIITL